MSVIKAFIAIFTAMIQLIVPSMAKLFSGEESFLTEWSIEEAYSEEKDYIINLEKNPDKDFVVLNLADVQLSDDDPYGEAGKSAEATITKLVADTQPDLITLTGDNATGVFAYTWLIALLDSFNIPWAPVMGNHEGQGCPDEFWCAYELANASKNSLFKFGPLDMGYGNYIINVTENGKIIHTLFMLDSHNNGIFTTDTGEEVSGYDNVWQNQIDWYEWAVNGIAAETGNVTESTVFMHIPLVQYRTAYDLAPSGGAVLEFGSRGESECPSPVDNGFFAAMQELGSTKNVIVGHDHVNDYSVVYEGIRLAYGLKTGYGSYNETTINGGSTLTIGSDGVGTFASHYVILEG